jgi:DNA-binding MarR family transcriptional regulator
MSESDLPQRAPKITDEQTATIMRLHARAMLTQHIAAAVNVDPKTVKRVIKRTLAAAAVARPDGAVELAESIATYREIQRTAWRNAEKAEAGNRSPAPLLREIRAAQNRVDELLGTQPIAPKVLEFKVYQAVILDVLKSESPEARSRIANKLRQIEGAPTLVIDQDDDEETTSWDG